MKTKNFILYFAISIFAFSAYAQSLSLSTTSGPLSNNAEIIMGFDTVTLVHDYDDLNVKNNTGSKIMVMLKKVYISMVPGTKNFMCWGVCTEEFLAGPLEILPNETNTLDFSCHYDPRGKTGISEFRYVFYIENNPLDSVCFRMKFKHPANIGINEINNLHVFTNAFPNPANNMVTIKYNADINENNTIVITDLLGKVIQSYPLSGNNGIVTINTAELSNGIYLYSFVADNKSILTKKLIINH